MVTDSVLFSTLSGGTPLASSAGASPESIQRFQQAHSRAVAQVNEAHAADGSSTNPLLSPLLSLNSDSTRLAAQADRAAQTEMKPSELMMLTMRSHEFLFHCELVANVANRSSDGMQQLFRQQS